MTAPTHPPGWRFDHSYTRLPASLFSQVMPVPVKKPGIFLLNEALCRDMGLDTDRLRTEGAAIFAGNAIPDGAAPIAQAYAGHQFGHFTMLGDGRAIVLGEHLTPDGRRLDVQLKGSGPTPYSRSGDGRAALGPMLREYIISEAMHALGIPTTRALAVATTGEPVFREFPRPGAVLTRIAASHIRVGTFEYAAARQDTPTLTALTTYTLKRHFPEHANHPQPALALLEQMIEKQAALIARWMLNGFIHGVMNTDNMALSGETIDYGPCAFMDRYDPATVFSSIDRQGRYAYGNQPRIAYWNVARFAESLLPILHDEHEEALALARTALEAFPLRFQAEWENGMRAKLGLFNQESEDAELMDSLLQWMRKTGADYTNTFVHLTQGNHPLTDPEFRFWHEQWQDRLTRQTQPQAAVNTRMRSANPVIIPRNHNVEEALAHAVEEPTRLHRLIEALQRPYDDDHPNNDYRQPAPPGLRYQTFCGT